jgi:hypothetical protein
MRIIVCGTRDRLTEAQEQSVWRQLSYIHEKTPITCIVQGGATGVDEAARTWVRGDICGETHEADWDRHGVSAGPIRNERMAFLGADLCLAFPGGNGTRSMIRCAVAYGIPVREVEW